MKAKVIKVGNFNTYNLVLPEKSFYRRKYSQSQYNQKVQWISGQLDKMKVDIVGLQEIFYEEALDDVLKNCQHLKKAHYCVALADGKLPRVGLISKFPIVKKDYITDFPVKLDIEGVDIPIHSFSRPVLRAEIAVSPKLKMVVFVVHLKSKRPDFTDGEGRQDPIHLAKGQARSLIRRAAEATALRALIMPDLKDVDTPVIVLGDVNDTGNAVTTRILSGAPPHRKYPEKVKHSIWDTLLYHAKDIQARQSYHDFYYSHIHNGHYEALDHIMVSQELVGPNPRRVGRIGYVKVFTDHLIDETLSDDGIELWHSDHGQVVATIELD